MNHLQIGFITATFAVPVLLWVAVRPLRPRHPGPAAIVERGIAWTFAVVLLVAYGMGIYLENQGRTLGLGDARLPFHLCDWATVATLLALLRRSQTAFELAYCWGLAGTFQALLTPAIALDGGLRVWCFLVFHSAIPAAVIWMLLGLRRRPSARCWRRVALWSQLYFVVAMIANAALGSNYGFLARRPDKPTLLDHFPNPPGGWGYRLAIDAFAMVLFALMLTPWRAGRTHGAAADTK